MRKQYSLISAFCFSIHIQNGQQQHHLPLNNLITCVELMMSRFSSKTQLRKRFFFFACSLLLYPNPITKPHSSTFTHKLTPNSKSLQPSTTFQTNTHTNHPSPFFFLILRKSFNRDVERRTRQETSSKGG